MWRPQTGIEAIKPVTPQPPSSAAFLLSNVAWGKAPLEATILSNISFGLRMLPYP
jgi:hypothetical protein